MKADIAALTPCVTTACFSLLTALARSCSHPFCSHLQRYLAMIYLGTSFLIQSSWIYIVVLLHLCLCRQSALKERKEIQLMEVAGFDSLCAAGEILTQLTLQLANKCWTVSCNLCEGWKQPHLHTFFCIHKWEQGKPNPQELLWILTQEMLKYVPKFNCSDNPVLKLVVCVAWLWSKGPWNSWWMRIRRVEELNIIGWILLT